MTLKKCGGIMFLLLCFAMIAVAFTTETWRCFTSSNGFSVTYPNNWFQIDVSPDRLQVISQRGGAKGVVIKHGEAEITVMEAPESSGKTLAQVVKYYAQGTTVLSRTDVEKRAKDRGDCNRIQRIVSKEAAVPPSDSPIPVPFIINTDFICDANGRKIVTLLRNWEGDASQTHYQEIASRMARNIRVRQ